MTLLTLVDVTASETSADHLLFVPYDRALVAFLARHVARRGAGYGRASVGDILSYAHYGTDVELFSLILYYMFSFLSYFSMYMDI